MNLDKIKPSAYTIKFDLRAFTELKIVATKWDDVGVSPITWAIKRSDLCMSKIDGDFYWEPRPSERDEDYFNEFRFDSAEEAYECWFKYHGEKP